MIPRDHLTARFSGLGQGEFVLRAGELALFGDADFGRERRFAGGGVRGAVEQAAEVADGGFEVVDRAGFFEGLAAAEVVGLLAFARVGGAGEEVLARGVDGVGAVGGCGCHIGWQCGERVVVCPFALLGVLRKWLWWSDY